MKIVIDSQACVGCGICPAVCPAVFKMNSFDGNAEVIERDFTIYTKAIEEARVSCPTSAIRISNVP